MIARAALKSDAALSLVLHGLKVAVALGINWLVLNSFAVDEFVVWSVTSSILMIATASDLGIGQYTVTGLVHRERGEWTPFVATSVLAMLPLTLAGGLFVVLALNGSAQWFAAAMAAMLVLRVATIPYGAVLNAANQYKQRKAIELAAYVAAAAAIAVIAATGRSIELALIALNASFVLAAVLTVLAALRYVDIRPAGPSSASPAAAGRLFRAALPFTLNNLSGLLTYGGFVWLCSLALPGAEVAKLAILHGFVLVTAWQLYDVFLKSRQADLADPARLSFYRHANRAVLLAAPIGFVLVGPSLLALIGNPLRLETAEVILFALFMMLELAHLYLQSLAQISLQHAARLTRYAFWRLGLLLAFVPPALMARASDSRVEMLLGLLVIGSALTCLPLMNLNGRPSGTSRPDQRPAGLQQQP